MSPCHGCGLSQTGPLGANRRYAPKGLGLAYPSAVDRPVNVLVVRQV
jgi:hypothetical protein